MVKALILNFILFGFYVNAYKPTVTEQTLKRAYSEFNIPQLNANGQGTFKYSNVQRPEDCRQRDDGVRETAVFSGEVCLNNILTGEKYPYTIFKVFVEKPDENGEYFIEELFPQDPNRPFYKTKGNGCMELTVSLPHKIYVRGRTVKVKLHFLSEEYNVYARVEPDFNPWQKQFQTYVDATKISDNDNVRFSTLGYPTFIIDNFQMGFIPSDELGESSNHRLFFLFQPFIHRLDVVHGSFSGPREFMRFGYYLVRLLLLKDPQETQSMGRIYSSEPLEVLRKESIDYKNLEYIAHADLIAKVDTKLAKLYVPFNLTTEQLDSMEDSRTLMSIEIVPADPDKFTYHEVTENGECRLDEEATTWSPYFDHELVNYAFVGAFHLNRLTNWNILRPVMGFSSDEIIEQSEAGSKNKYFDLRKDAKSEDYKGDIPRACVGMLLFSECYEKTILLKMLSNDISLNE